MGKTTGDVVWGEKSRVHSPRISVIKPLMPHIMLSTGNMVMARQKQAFTHETHGAKLDRMYRILIRSQAPC